MKTVLLLRSTVNKLAPKGAFLMEENGTNFIKYSPFDDIMFGITFEMVMRSLLLENGYSVAPATEYADFLGFDPEELVDIAREAAPGLASGVDKHRDWQVLSVKQLLDHYFKVDDLLQLPYNKKKGEKPVVCGLQWFTYSDNDIENLGFDPEKKISKKEKQLKQAWPACQEIFLDRVALVAVHIPKSWNGLGFRTEAQNEHIKKLIYQLVSKLKEPSDGPITIRLSFEV
jgi:hypothetical protein